MDELKNFYSLNYSSNLMNLVLVGKHSLDELEEALIQNFS
jgi:secreted Zn-dependent insulinase-like peptidase